MTVEGQHDDQLREAVKERDALRAMIAGPGWEIVNNWLTEEIQIRRDKYEISGPHTLNDATVICFQRAELCMLRTLQDMPRKLLDTHQEAIDLMKEATGGYDADD